VGRRGVHLLLASVVLMWGLAFVAIKLALDHASPMGLTIWRFVITASALLLLMAVRRDARPRLERKDLGRLAVMAVVGVGGYHLAINYGEQFVSAGVASLIVAAMPVMVAILASRYLGESITAAKRVGIGLALAGVAVLALFGTPGSSLEVHSVAGALVTALSPVCWSVYTVLSKPLVAKYGPMAVTATTMIAGTVLILPIGLPTAIGEIGGMDASDWGWIAFLALGSTVYAYLVWNLALSRIEASNTAAWVYPVPLVALFWGWLLLAERLTVWVLVGGAMVLGGVILTERVAPRMAARAAAGRAAEAA
jgi:drug/metabolite transporter (DMT)-like permease